jgi:hypothetical protein
MKYKVGDMVRVREDLVRGQSYGHYLFIKGMWHLAGKTFRITKVDRGAGCYRIDCPGRFCWTDEMLEGVNVRPQKTGKHVGVYIDGNKVIAVNLETGKNGIARCHPDDAFDFYIGAKLALERLEEIEKPYGWLKKGTKYYVPDTIDKELFQIYVYDASDWAKRSMERGIVFKTPEEAIACAKKMLEVAKQED